MAKNGGYPAEFSMAMTS